MTDIPKRVNGKNLFTNQQYQASQQVEHVTYQIPATTNAVFGGICTYDFKTVNTKIYELMLELNVSAITGITSPPTNYPVYCPSDFWIKSIEMVVNGKVIENKYPLENFINAQLMMSDEKRRITNDLSGPYDSIATRFAMSNANTKWYIQLNTFITQMADGYDLFNNSHEIQMRVTYNNVSQIVSQSSGTGTPIASILNSKLIIKATKFNQDYSVPRLMFLQKQPLHYLCDEVRQFPYPISSGTSNISIPLSFLKGGVVYLMFVLQDNTTMTGENLFSFSKIQDFEIISSSNTSLTGGAPITHQLNQINVKKWSQSSYITESVRGLSNSNVYMWSFSPDIIRGFYSGTRYGFMMFSGAEVLRINMVAPLANANTLTVMAFTNMTVQQTAGSVSKTED